MSEPTQEPNQSPPRPPQGWVRKFGRAGIGTRAALRSERSFIVHLPMTIAVLILAAVLGVDRTEWCVLIVCIGGVWAAELFNTSLEVLSTAITVEHDERIGHALDVASGAVLIASITAAIVGVAIFAPRIFVLTS